MSATKRVYGISGAVALLFCALQGFAPAWLSANALYILFGVVFTVGLIHGSLDYEIAASHNKGTKVLPFLRNYLLQMALVAVVWVFFPGIALALFIAFTGWHFGETDLAIFRLKATYAQTFFYGLGIIGWILGSHIAETLQYLADLSVMGADTAANAFLAQNQLALMGISFLLVSGVALLSELRKNFLTLGLLAGILTLTGYLPLLPAFALYFGFWHSLHSLTVIQADIQHSYAELIKRALPFLGASIIGTFLLLGILGYLQLNSVLILFIFISSLTLPHAQVMHGTFSRFRAGAGL